MATLTLGQMLDTALGSSRDGAIDFDQLHSLLNGMLSHLGLRDLLVQENGEPVEGAEGSPFSASFLEELKRKVDAHEEEITELRAVCQGLREDVDGIKLEQSRMAEEMQKMFDPSTMDEFRNQLLESVMSAVKDMMKPSSDKQQNGSKHQKPGDDKDLIVIGNEITLLERSRTPKRRDSQSSKGKTHDKGKDLLEEVSSGSNSVARNGGQKDVRQKVQRSNTGRNGMGQDDTGQIKDEEIKRSISKAEDHPSPLDVPPEMTDMGEIKDEETEMSISKAEDHPSPLDVPPEMTDVGEIKDEEAEMSTSKAEAFPSPLDALPEMSDMGETKDEEIEKKSSDGSFTASGTHPGAPGTPLPVQQVQPVQDHPESLSPELPESVAGTSRFPTPKEAHERSSSRMEPFPDEAGLMLLTVPSSDYAPCEQLVQPPGRHSETPPTSPGRSRRPPRGRKQYRGQEPREQAGERYSRRSPMYCGGRHTSVCPVQRMEPLLPDPNKPGVFDLVGRDGLVYRGRNTLGTD